METEDLSKFPLIPLPQLGRVRGVGADAVEGASARAGVTPTKCPDGIRRFTIAEARMVDAELRRTQKR